MVYRVWLYNSLDGTKQEFEPIDSERVSMYVCGPTVYDRAHLGNARAMVVFDQLWRVLSHAYEKVVYVRNITDVDDKINARSQETGVSIAEITAQTTDFFHKDMASLNCALPTIEPRATQHIDHMIKMIQQLIAGGNAYEAEGHVLFSIHSYGDYGSLSRRSRKEMVAGARVEVAPYKKDAGDFVLWKPSEGDEPGWDSPWGFGRPGWHIECSAMSTCYLGESFDIHGGGADLKFPHHENEIAQSVCAHPHSDYARYWVHNGFLTVNGEKMSKSSGTFITVHDALSEALTNHSGQTIRLVFLNGHYRKPLDWNEKAVDDAKKMLDYFYQALKESIEKTDDPLPDVSVPESVVAALYDDINTPKAVTELHVIAKEVYKAQDGSTRIFWGTALKEAGKLLGLFHQGDDYISSDAWFGGDAIESDVLEVVEQIKAARAEKDFATADGLRDMLAERGYVLEYKGDGGVGIKGRVEE